MIREAAVPEMLSAPSGPMRPSRQLTGGTCFLEEDVVLLLDPSIGLDSEVIGEGMPLTFPAGLETMAVKSTEVSQWLDELCPIPPSLNNGLLGKMVGKRRVFGGSSIGGEHSLLGTLGPVSN